MPQRALRTYASTPPCTSPHIHSSSYPCTGLRSRLGTVVRVSSACAPVPGGHLFTPLLHTSRKYRRQRLTRVTSGNRVGVPVPQRLADRRDGDQHDRPNEANDERVEDDRLLVRLALLHIVLDVVSLSLVYCERQVCVRGSGMSAGTRRGRPWWRMASR